MKRGVMFGVITRVSVVLVMVIFLVIFARAVVLNEVMPHSNNSWNHEWIELYNPENQEINLSGWKIGDKSSNDTINSLKIPALGYALIVDDNVNKDNKTGCQAFDVLEGSCVEFSTIGSGLNDENETVYLYNITELVESFSWNPNIKSSGKSWSLNISGWQICQPTPGLFNNCFGNSSNETNQSNKNIILLNYPNQVYNNKTNFTISLDLINFSSGFYDLKIDIKNSTKYLNRFWTENGWSSKNSWIENFTFINNSNFSLDLVSIIDIDDFFIGNASIQIKLRNSTNPEYLFESNISNISIINGTIKIQENETQENNEEDKETNSNINIKEFPSKSRFGQEIEVETKIYKGDTSRYALYAYVQDSDENKVSEKITEHLRTKYRTYKKTFSIELDCINKSGNYEIVVEGLGERETEEIYLESCSNITINPPSSTSLSSQIQEQKISNRGTNESSKDFSSDLLTGYATKTLEIESFSFMKVMFYILSAIVLIMIIALIIKKLRR